MLSPRLAALLGSLTITASCDGLTDSTTVDAPEVVMAPLVTSVVPEKELFLTSLTAMNDHKYIDYKPGKFNTEPDGGWSFGRLIDNLMTASKPTDQQRSDFVMGWLQTWESPQVVNGQAIAPRALVRSVIIDPWKQRSIGVNGNTATKCAAGPASDATCKLSFLAGDVPFQLIAIVFRPDLRTVGTDITNTSGGQGRFIFALTDGAGTPLPFTVIFEYTLPASNQAGIKAIADAVHKLGSKAFGAGFNKDVQALTAGFTARGVAPWRRNGSALLQLRTNDVALAEPGSDPSHPFGVLWELREFVIGTDGLLHNDTMKLEPKIGLSGTQELGDWVAANEADVLANTYTLPDAFADGEPLLAASSFAPFDFSWQIPGVSEETRHAFALQTCNGCHLNETGTGFLHAFPLQAGAEATLSPWLAAQIAADGPRTQEYINLLNTPSGNVKTGKNKDHRDADENDDDDHGHHRH